ncbi:transglycosylase domain-containing protein [Archangium lansingense]|uniref:Transglycosylase domain-containing protein n=1 Tax=Archangium lansingense TaxID=2995310 RepID=A0ABT3ZYV9_9BACT|nr:transglycosylase domain-containing protein [Archangium lansinium]MCY1073929.1 transglycosylase domain-containing protein [Archangium lansinium]
MKTLLWLVLFLIGLAGVALPALYLHTASKLPQLETEFDLEKQLRHSIEGERMSLQAGTFDRKRSIAYTRPDFSRLPKDLVALYISQLGCPTYFQTRREDGAKWAWRLFSVVTFGTEPPGDGVCERLIAARLATALGISGALEQAVAANRLHSFLQKDQLIAYDLSTLYFDRGVVGVEDAAFKVFGRELDTLKLSEMAELALTLPPHNMYGDALVCRNASLIRQNRDVLLLDLAGFKLVTEERARTAMAQPVICR